MEGTGNYYLIKHIVLISGLTDRMIRNHIASGLLKGKKINGLWHFAPEEVTRFLSHPVVRPGIRTKQQAIVQDFLREDKKKICQACLILDIPEKDKKETAEYFCYRIMDEGLDSIHFAFDGMDSTARVILKGNTDDVLSLANGFMQSEP